MYNQNIQDALLKLDKKAKRKNTKRYALAGLIGIVFTLGTLGGYVYTQSTSPKITEGQLSRLVIIASRTSDNDPVRLIGEIERYMGKPVEDMNSRERANAMGFLMSHIELHHKKQEMISY